MISVRHTYDRIYADRETADDFTRQPDNLVSGMNSEDKEGGGNWIFNEKEKR